LVALLTLLKGLPMTYNRDLQEDKERLFDSVDTVRATTRICAAMFQNLRFNREICSRAASDPALLATDLADYLVRKGVAFRKAHHVVGELVALSEKQGKPLDQLTLDELRLTEPKFGTDVRRIFAPGKSLARRNLPGAPGPKEVKKQILRWRKLLR